MIYVYVYEHDNESGKKFNEIEQILGEIFKEWKVHL